MLSRKIVKIGNSSGVILPKFVLELLGWKDDDTIIIEQGTDESELRIINVRVSSVKFNVGEDDAVHGKD